MLHSGDTEGGVSDLRRRENKFETEEGGLLEVYTRIESPEGQPLLFEAYYSVETVKQRLGRGARRRSGGSRSVRWSRCSCSAYRCSAC